MITVAGHALRGSHLPGGPPRAGSDPPTDRGGPAGRRETPQLLAGRRRSGRGRLDRRGAGGWTGDWLADELSRAEITVHRVSTRCSPGPACRSARRTPMSSPSCTSTRSPSRPTWDPRPGGAHLRAGRSPGLAGDLRRTSTRPAADRPRGAGRAGPPRRLSGGGRHPRRLVGAPAAQPAGAGEDQPVRGGSGAGRRCRHSSGADGRQVQAKSGGIVVLTDGAAGSLGLGAEVDVRHGGAEAAGPVPGGSGDAYLGGLLTALDREDDLGTASGWPRPPVWRTRRSRDRGASRPTSSPSWPDRPRSGRLTQARERGDARRAEE